MSFYFNGSTGEIKDLDNFQNRIHMISYSTISRKDNVMPAFDCDFFFLGSKLIKAKPLIGMNKKATLCCCITVSACTDRLTFNKESVK